MSLFVLGESRGGEPERQQCLTLQALKIKIGTMSQARLTWLEPAKGKQMNPSLEPPEEAQL